MEIKMFHLENDRDTAKVRFIPYPGGFVYAKLRVHYPKGDPMHPIRCTGDTCEYCKTHSNPPLRYKYFFALYDEDAKCIKFWERWPLGTEQLCDTLNNYKDIEHQVFAITRFGDKGNLATRYALTPLYKSATPELDPSELPSVTELFDFKYKF